jgi:hypothetical protein
MAAHTFVMGCKSEILKIGYGACPYIDVEYWVTSRFTPVWLSVTDDAQID